MAAGLTLSREWLAMFDALPDDAARGRLLRAVSGYALCGIMPKGLTETETECFTKMRKTIITRRRNDRAYQNRMIHTLSTSKPHDSYAPEPHDSCALTSKPHDSYAQKPASLINNKEPLNNPPITPINGSNPPTVGKSTARRVFQKPTVSEIASYCKERGNNIDPQAFFDHHEATGWIIGKNKTPVKDWKAVIRQWERYDKETKDKNKPKKRDYSGF